jgi:hypothetical protein
MNNVTLVSAFMSDITTSKCLNTNNNYKKYTEYFIPLLQANINKIIFIDEKIIDNYKCYENDNTKIIPFIKESSYLYEYLDSLVNFQPNSNNLEKDTIQFMFTQCHKTEWIKLAIEITDYHETSPSNQFIWVDFGIKHIFKCSNEEFIEKIERLNYCKYDAVRIASIWNINIDYQINIYNDICWYFGGGVFGGSKKYLLEFAKEMKLFCLEIMNTKKTIMWEVNIWYLIYKKNKDLFTLYECDHNNTMIDNY